MRTVEGIEGETAMGTRSLSSRVSWPEFDPTLDTWIVPMPASLMRFLSYKLEIIASTLWDFQHRRFRSRARLMSGMLDMLVSCVFSQEAGPRSAYRRTETASQERLARLLTPVGQECRGLHTPACLPISGAAEPHPSSQLLVLLGGLYPPQLGIKMSKTFLSISI